MERKINKWFEVHIWYKFAEGATIFSEARPIVEAANAMSAGHVAQKIYEAQGRLNVEVRNIKMMANQDIHPAE